MTDHSEEELRVVRAELRSARERQELLADALETAADQLEAMVGCVAERDRLRVALARATYLASNLHGMIDRETWRASGGDDGQGHYEGDYRAEQVATELRALAALVSPVSATDAPTGPPTYPDTSDTLSRPQGAGEEAP